MKKLGNGFEEWTMISGDTVFYRDSDHSYWSEVRLVRGKLTAVRSSRLPSPSTVAKYSDPNPDNLMDWAARKELEGVSLLAAQNGSVDFEDAKAINAALKEKKLTWRDLRNAAGDKGTTVHDAFEKGLHGTPVPLSDCTPEEQPHLIALDRFFNDYPDIAPVQTEQVVYSRQHGFAGRFDARVRVNGETWLVDLKTSKFLGRSYHVQLAGYKLAIRESGFGECDRCMILQTREDSTYRLVPARADEDHFLHCLSLYKAGKSLDTICREDLKEAA